MTNLIESHTLGKITATYLKDPETNAVALHLIPSQLLSKIKKRRQFLEEKEIASFAKVANYRFPAIKLDSLAQVSCPADGCVSGFGAGRTMRNSPTVTNLTFKKISKKTGKNFTALTTTFRHKDGWHLHHTLHHNTRTNWLESFTTVHNTTKKTLTLEMLASASISGITPFSENDAPRRLVLHRFRSCWSMEGRPVSEPVECLQLERSWTGWGMRSERFGAVGTMPVNGWFPRALIEDTQASVTWGLQVNCPTSWQIEIYRRHDDLALSGGLADHEFGHWSKQLAPGEKFTSPTATLACIIGGRDECCDALNSALEPALAHAPDSEKKLPIIFNEWSTSWGNPTHENMVSLADKLKGLGITYLVIDAGWYAREPGNWGAGHGDWIPNKTLYPNGLRATADAIRARGFIPGIWYEMETCGAASDTFHKTKMLLARNDIPLTNGSRRHLDMRHPAARKHLDERLIANLDDCGFGYLKVDYNDTIGIGADGAESPGEALRQWGLSSLDYFRRIREKLPQLVIENCSSGGHRLCPPYMQLTSMSSFSDAHECPEIPIIAANLHRLLLPRQNQIWAVLRHDDSDHRTIYSLTAGFLGRLCLSGDVPQQGSKQHNRIKEATALYRKAAPTILSGKSKIYGTEQLSYRHPEGWQAVLRTRQNDRQILLVLHTFAQPSAKQITLPLPHGKWHIQDSLSSGKKSPVIRNNTITIPIEGSFRGHVFLLQKSTN